MARDYNTCSMHRQGPNGTCVNNGTCTDLASLYSDRKARARNVTHTYTHTRTHTHARTHTHTHTHARTHARMNARTHTALLRQFSQYDDAEGSYICRVAQNSVYTPCMTVYLVIFKPKIPYVHRICMVLANPKHLYSNRHLRGSFTYLQVALCQRSSLEMMNSSEVIYLYNN